METPNTRSRRKREMMEGSSQDEMPGPSVAWLHDQNLRRAVLLATEDDVMTPPTPTQKPRPISSRFSPSSCSYANSNAASTLESANCPARKRPCRSNRSLGRHSGRVLASSSSSSSPNISSTSNIGSNTNPNTGNESRLKGKANSLTNMSNSTSSNSNSLSYSGDEGKTRLDLLLERVQLLNSSPDVSAPRDDETSKSKKGGVYEDAVETPCRSSAAGRSLRSRADTDADQALAAASKGSMALRTTSTPSKSRSRKNDSDPRTYTRTKSSSSLTSASNEQSISPAVNHTSIRARPPSLPPTTESGVDGRHQSTSLDDATTSLDSHTRNPLSPIKTGLAPRIGLGSQHLHKHVKPHSTSSTGYPNKEIKPSSSSTFTRTTSASGRAFRTPFLEYVSLRTPGQGQGSGAFKSAAAAANVGIRSSPRRTINTNSASLTGNVNGQQSMTSRGPAVRASGPVRGPIPNTSAATSSSTITSAPSKSSLTSVTVSLSCSRPKEILGAAPYPKDKYQCEGNSRLVKRPSPASRSSTTSTSDTDISTHSLAPTHTSNTSHGHDDKALAHCRNSDMRFMNYDIGGDEGDGDSSFDSFDGIFADGGEEIERLLMQVDGSNG